MALRPAVGSVLAAVLLAVVVPLFTAFAHTPPERTEPEAGAVLERPPTAVDVWFGADLDRSKPAELRVVHNPSGRRIDRGGEDPLDPQDADHVRVALEPDLAPGRYVVSWEATGVDGHPVRGGYSFSVAEPERARDDQVPLMLAVFGAAAFVVSVGTVGYVLRRLLGLVEGPPTQPPAEHH